MTAAELMRTPENREIQRLLDRCDEKLRRLQSRRESAAWKKAHPEAVRLYRAKPEVKERQKQHAANYRRKYRARVNARARSRTAAHPEIRREIDAKYRSTHLAARREQVRRSVRKWYRAHPEQAADTNRRMHAQRRRVPTERFTLQEIFQRDKWRCQLCGQSVDRSLRYPHPDSASLDHIVPLAKGGAHTRANVQLAHLGCNAAKGGR